MSIRCEAEKRVSHGEGLTRQPNERVAYWVLAVSHAGVTLRNCAATYPGSEQFCVGLFNKRHVLWYATCTVPEQAT